MVGAYRNLKAPFKFNKALSTRLFTDDLAPTLLATTRPCGRGGKYLQTGRESYIKVLPKKDKDHTHLELYRPIALINVDAKILSLILTHRLIPILSTLLHPVQQDSPRIARQ